MAKTTKKPKRDLVFYCPGSAGGSPATMDRDRAALQLEKDMAHIETMEKAGGLATPVCMPHIGGTCSRCKR